MTDNNLPVVSGGTGVALRNASKSLKITNKLLAEILTEEDWKWWLNLSNEWKFFLLKDGLNCDFLSYRFLKNSESKRNDIFQGETNISLTDKVRIESYLQSIFEIKEIELSGKNISSIYTLLKLKYIRYLDLSYNNITNFNEIANLKNLEFLDITGNNVDDFSFLHHLTNLKSLSVDGETNFEQLCYSIENLAYLSELLLSMTGLTSIKGLERLKKLKTLDVSNNGIEDLIPLTDLVLLEDLNIGGCNIGGSTKNLDLSKLKNLKKLNITIENEEQFKQVRNLTKLEDLTIDTNGEFDFNNLRFLKDFKNLEILSIVNQKGIEINDISTLLALPKLRDLHLNKTTNISVLATLKNLVTLSLVKNDIIDLSFLANLTNLIELNLAQNNIRDISALANLENLVILDLGNYTTNSSLTTENKISDISALAKLKNLRWLGVSKNPIYQGDIDWLQEQLPNCKIYF